MMLPNITEAEFMSQVLQFAKLRGWLVAHFRAGMTRSGRWATQCQADAAGFPDLLMVRGDRLIVAELKVGKNKTTDAQSMWLAAFTEAEVPAFVWYPNAWPEIEKVLM